jgi:hypothetical protein
MRAWSKWALLALVVITVPSTARNQDLDFVGPPLLVPDAGVPLPNDAGLDQTEAKLDSFKARVVILEGLVKDLKLADTKKPTDAETPQPPNNL